MQFAGFFRLHLPGNDNLLSHHIACLAPASEPENPLYRWLGEELAHESMQFEKRPDFLGDDSTARSTVVCLGPPQHFLREALNATVLPSPAVLAKMGHNAPKIPST